MRSWKSAIIIIVAVLVVTACTTRDYQPPIRAFSAATKTATTNFEEYQRALDQTMLAVNINFALQNRSTLRPANGECIPGAARCRLVLRTRDGQERPFVPETISPRTAQLLAGLVRYSANLEAIAAAEHENEIRDAADDAGRNLIALAKAADALNSELGYSPIGLDQKVAGIGTPLADATTYLLGKYADALKVAALREATGAMEEMLPTLTRLFGAVADASITIKRNQLGEAFSAADLAYNTEPITRAKLDALQTAAQAYDASLRANPTGVFVALETAHRALAQALRHPELSFDDLWPLLHDVAVEAQQLAALGSTIAKAGQKTQN